MTQAFEKNMDGQRMIWLIVLGGIVSLAVAMGIGRFAFTPPMPLMVRDGILDIAAGTEWAAANYVGYLIGALSASKFGKNPRFGMLLVTCSPELVPR
jgi:ABC-type phosphate transport system permease subunit